MVGFLARSSCFLLVTRVETLEGNATLPVAAASVLPFGRTGPVAPRCQPVNGGPFAQPSTASEWFAGIYRLFRSYLPFSTVADSRGHLAITSRTFIPEQERPVLLFAFVR